MFYGLDSLLNASYNSYYLYKINHIKIVESSFFIGSFCSTQGCIAILIKFIYDVYIFMILKIFLHRERNFMGFHLLFSYSLLDAYFASNKLLILIKHHLNTLAFVICP